MSIVMTGLLSALCVMLRELVLDMKSIVWGLSDDHRTWAREAKAIQAKDKSPRRGGGRR